MTDFPLIRMLLALTVAFWSPGRCCCGGSMERHGEGSMAVVSRADTSPGVARDRAPMESGPAEGGTPCDCCESFPTQPQENGPGIDAGSPTCGCDLSPGQMNPNGAVFLTVSGSSVSTPHKAPAIGPSFAADELSRRFDRIGAQWIGGAIAARKESLFARRCLLIV